MEQTEAFALGHLKEEEDEEQRMHHRHKKPADIEKESLMTTTSEISLASF